MNAMENSQGISVSKATCAVNWSKPQQGQHEETPCTEPCHLVHANFRAFKKVMEEYLQEDPSGRTCGRALERVVQQGVSTYT